MVPVDVIVPPDKPVPAVTDVTVPSPPLTKERAAVLVTPLWLITTMSASEIVDADGSSEILMSAIIKQEQEL
jgi:hypothetical protein